MKFTIQKSAIVDVLSKVQGLVGRRSSLAITECILINADNSGIHVIATDLETGYEGEFSAVVEVPERESGTVELPGGEILPDDRIAALALHERCIRSAVFGDLGLETLGLGLGLAGIGGQRSADGTNRAADDNGVAVCVGDRRGRIVVIQEHQLAPAQAAVCFEVDPCAASRAAG